MSILIRPRRGEVWRADLDPIHGHEQGGVRPIVVISDDIVNTSPAQMIISVPLTNKQRNLRSHVPVAPPEGGLTMLSFVKCEDIRALSFERLEERIGRVSDATMDEVEYRLRVLLKL